MDWVLAKAGAKVADVAVQIAAEHEGIELFLPKPAEIIWSLVAIMVIAVPLIKIAVPKLTKVLDERAEMIEGKIESAAKQESEAAETLSKYNTMIHGANAEAAGIITSAKDESKEIVANAKKQADTDAARIIDNAKKQVFAEKAAAEVQLKGDVSYLAVSLAEKIIGEQLTNRKVQDKMIDEFIASIDETEVI
ncbi:MAG: F0F1 ATP synthase subunit B [Bifidobacteriaceae bacterium]|jgi:F-type H+-transporting ATPase subunit b|nr:F0F1 ATP synthase subunit B [Bifidobacteriaceae bacterium]